MREASYPDPDEFDERLYENLCTLPDKSVIDIGWIRANLWNQV